jgi:hypothetical protein
MNNGLLGFPGPKIQIDQRTRNFSMDKPPLLEFASVWIDATRQVYSGTNLTGTPVTTHGSSVGSIRSIHNDAVYFNTRDLALYPVELRLHQDVWALYSDYEMNGNLAGMVTNMSVAHSEKWVLMCSQGTVFDFGVAFSSTAATSYFNDMFQDGGTGYNTNPDISERNGVSTFDLAPVENWFLLRIQQSAEPATSDLAMFQEGRSLYIGRIYIAEAIIFDKVLSAAEITRVLNWFKWKYPSIVV